MHETADLFSPRALRSLRLPNRIVVSPMCQYSSEDGFANNWHLVHLRSRAVGGAGLILVEASAVLPEGRITPGDLGLWKDEHIPKLREIVDFVHDQGAYIGIQLAHAGRKGSMAVPWDQERVIPPEEGGWSDVFAPSALPFDRAYAMPRALDQAGIRKVVDAFPAPPARPSQAGLDPSEYKPPTA